MRAEELGDGLAGGLAVSSFYCGGEEAGARRVVGRDAHEAGDCLRASEGGEALGLLLGGGGETVEDGDDLGGFEEGEEFADGEVVVGGEVWEGEVAGEVVVEEGVALGWVEGGRVLSLES